ncbi:MAG: RodZ domain-containing protein [Sulfuricaulis sp.]
MENVNPVSPDTNAPSSGPGRLLHEARQDLRLAPEDVAQILHLSAKQIISLEMDDYKNLPGPTYVRGYLRNYAQLLGLAPDKVLKSYNSLTLPSRSMSLPKSAPPLQITSSDRLVKAASLGVAAVVLGLVYLWWRNNGELPDVTGAPTAVVSQGPAIESYGSSAASVPPPVAPPNDMIARENPVSELATVRPPPQSSAEASRSQGETVLPAGKVPPVHKKVTMSGMILNVTPTGPTVSQSGNAPSVSTDRAIVRVSPDTDIAAGTVRSHMVLRATQESWADIRDAYDNKLLYENIPAGRSVTIEGVAPFSVFLGHADGVQVEFNGRNFDVSRYKRGQVARFTLGNETAVNN